MPNEKNIYGPDNPHPLSSRKTELIWEGKYDEYGNRREVDIAGCAMPMQKLETIDEAYRDMWGKGTDSYLHMMYERLVEKDISKDAD